MRARTPRTQNALRHPPAAAALVWRWRIAAEAAALSDVASTAAAKQRVRHAPQRRAPRTQTTTFATKDAQRRCSLNGRGALHTAAAAAANCTRAYLLQQRAYCGRRRQRASRPTISLNGTRIAVLDIEHQTANALNGLRASRSLRMRHAYSPYCSPLTQQGRQPSPINCLPSAGLRAAAALRHFTGRTVA